MRKSLAIVLASMGVAAPALAQTGNNIYADPTNLKVLPKDISADELRGLMRNFSFATGIRCSGCHVAAEGAPLAQWDFSLDDQEQKNIARSMMKMTRKINKTVSKIEEVDVNDRVNVTCMTCHRGIERPVLIQGVLDQHKAENDAAGAVTNYRELREIYYGTHSYDFSPFTLGEYAESAARDGATEFALALHEMNRDLHPDDGYAFVAWGNTLFLMEDYEGAISAYEQAIEREPENSFYGQLLERAQNRLAEN